MRVIVKILLTLVLLLALGTAGFAVTRPQLARTVLVPLSSMQELERGLYVDAQLPEAQRQQLRSDLAGARSRVQALFGSPDAGGNEYGFHGVYHESLAPERLVYTFEFEGAPGNVLLATIPFEEQPGGKTKLTDRSVFQSQAARDGMVQGGMESGAVDLMERLAELVANMQG